MTSTTKPQHTGDRLEAWRNIPIDTHNCHLAITACGELSDEIARLREELREANEAIRELQQEACDRAGLPMPSQRSVVDRLRAANAAMRDHFAEIEDCIAQIQGALRHYKQPQDVHFHRALKACRDGIAKAKEQT